RRELLELIAIIALSPACKTKSGGGSGAGTGASGSGAGSAAPAAAPATSLDAAAYRALDAASRRILPAGGTVPGAGEAKVIDFLDRQPAIQPLARVAPALIALARALDDAARARKAPDFSQLAGAEQDTLIEAVAGGTLGTKLPEKELFRLLH